MSLHTMTMPDLGEGIVEAEIVAWFVGVGDTVTTETAIVDVLTDKATVEVTAPVAGVIAAILVDEGDVVTVGSELVQIDVDGAGAPTASAASAASAAATEPITAVAADPITAVAPPTPAPVQTAPPRATPAPATPVPASPADRGAEAATPAAVRPLAAPTVRRLAAELGVDLHDVAGTGPGGRILRADVEGHRPGVDVVAPTRRPDTSEQVRGVRRTIAQRLTAAWAAPHITCVDDVDVTELEALRATLNQSASDQITAPARITMLPFIARAIVLSIAEHPQVNATFDAATETLTTYGAVHLGIATQTDRGLLVPVVPDADRRSLTDLATAITSVAQAARDGSASRDLLGGSTITVTSLGALGGLMNTPILNAPEVAIVGVNKLRTEPVWNGTTFVPRSVINLSASFDHRIIDGWDAAVFVQRIKQLLETPALLTLGWAR